MKYAAGAIKRVHVLRIEPGEDVLLCIQIESGVPGKMILYPGER